MAIHIILKNNVLLVLLQTPSLGFSAGTSKVLTLSTWVQASPIFKLPNALPRVVPVVLRVASYQWLALETGFKTLECLDWNWTSNLEILYLQGSPAPGHMWWYVPRCQWMSLVLQFSKIPHHYINISGGVVFRAPTFPRLKVKWYLQGYLDLLEYSAWLHWYT